MKSLTVTLVHFTDGSVDTEGSVGAFRSALDAALIEQDAMSEGIALAVEAVFDTLNGARANMPYVINETLRRLSTTPANYNLLTEKVGEFIRANAQGDEPTYHIGKGKGGGVIRLCDESEDARKKRLASAEKKADKDAK
ncbi:hypothetical protein UFOVP1290_153 [uncultured Caudovirales phage]|uniref:Uncharacterized protein n=1 Tax=uncultured Caudovirales phage TaxID=2100421 RepID=A0A6J5RH03_9CAUD|nr:hypothetical protein UFOVP1290_153 [uncultured Caudovirales phage]